MCVWSSVHVMTWTSLSILNVSEPPRGDPGLHVADIKPPGQIRTVEVEVEPLPEDHTDEGGAGGEERTQESSVEKDGTNEQPADLADTDQPKEEASEQQAGQDTPTTAEQATPTSEETTPTATATTTAQPGKAQREAPPTSLDMQPSRDSDSYGLDHPSPITRLPPLMSPSDDLLGQRSPAGGKKKSKPKPLSSKDLVACHQDVARGNKVLTEPTTPEFKPTTEWVSA